MVIGKYLAMVSVFLIPCMLFCAYPLIISTQGKAYFKADYASILVFFLLGCVYIAIGSFISAMTESQIIAAIGTFGVLMVVYLCIYNMTKNGVLAGGLELIGTIILVVLYFVKSSLYEGLLSTIFGKFALVSTFTSAAENSLLDIGGIVMYLTLIGVFLFLTVQSIQKRRFS